MKCRVIIDIVVR